MLARQHHVHVIRTRGTLEKLPVPPLDMSARFNIPNYDHIHPLPTFNQTFACVRCHNIRNTTRTSRDGWAHFIAWATAGLLHGHEVPPPQDFISRKRPYHPQLLRAPSQRREQVLQLLLKNLKYKEIANQLKVSYRTVHAHVKILYKQHHVHSREELAKHLKVKLPTRPPRENPLHQAIQRELVKGHSYAQIAGNLGTTYHTVHHRVKILYRQHKVHSLQELQLKYECLPLHRLKLRPRATFLR